MPSLLGDGSLVASNVRVGYVETVSSVPKEVEFGLQPLDALGNERTNARAEERRIQATPDGRGVVPTGPSFQVAFPTFGSLPWTPFARRRNRKRDARRSEEYEIERFVGAK